MSLRVVDYQPSHEPAVRAFNSRLLASGTLPFRAPESAPCPNPQMPVPGIEFRHLVVVDDSGFVRGTYFVRSQPFFVQGKIHRLGQLNAPLSEGIIDKRYAPVGAVMLSHALSEWPLMFATGMGGPDKPLPRMMHAMGWQILETPFYFLVLNGKRFLRNIGPLRNSVWRRVAADFLASTGVGGGVIRSMQLARKRGRFDARYARTPIAEFSHWADQIWEANAGRYSLSAVRNAAYLQFIYPRSERAFYGVQVNGAQGPAGWVEMLDCQPLERSYFGSMRVAALLDGVGPPEAISSLVHGAIDAALERNADLIISNQMHEDWTAGLRNAGFWQGPSNYLLGLSKELGRLLGHLEAARPRIHFNRGDGDGRVNLMAENTETGEQKVAS